MCIKIVRWFCCPQHEAHDPPRQPSNPPSSSSRPWESWEHGGAISATDFVEYGLPSYQGFAYARHKEQAWIRCAITRGRLCEEAPHEVRTEVHTALCSNCAGEDSCVRNVHPVHVHIGGHTNLSPEKEASLKLAVKAYFDELVAIVEWGLLDAPFGKTLTAEAHYELFGALCCTEDARHIAQDMDEEDYVTDANCAQFCNSNAQPQAHNLSRALRIQSAHAARARDSVKWNRLSSQIGPQLVHDRGHFPRQQWLNISDAMMQGVDLDMEKASTLLTSLGPEVQSPDFRPPGWVDMDFIMKLREILACFIDNYVVLDPGLSATFRELLTKNHILTIYNPQPVANHPGLSVLPCRHPAAPNVANLVRRFEEEFMRLDDLGGLYRLYTNRTSQRRADLIGRMKSNRYILRNNILRLSVQIDAFIHMCAPARDASSQVDEPCTICGDKFTDSTQAPPHLSVRSTPCCSQPLHFNCLRSLLRAKRECPLCRRDFSEFGDYFSIDWRRPTIDLSDDLVMIRPLTAETTSD